MPVPENKIRNKAIVSLFICGFPKKTIAKLLHCDARNTFMFIKKYMPRYGGEIMENISKYIAKGQTNTIISEPVKK